MMDPGPPAKGLTVKSELPLEMPLYISLETFSLDWGWDGDVCIP